MTDPHAAAETAGLIGTLGLNGKLLIAQLLNFGIVLAIMWRWVYRPLVKMMDERSRKIRQGLADAEAAGSAKSEAEEARRAAIAEAKAEAQRIVSEGEARAEAQRKASLDKARQEVEEALAQGRAALEGDRARMLAEAKGELLEVVALAVEKIAREKIDAKKDERLLKEALAEAGKRV